MKVGIKTRGVPGLRNGEHRTILWSLVLTYFSMFFHYTLFIVLFNPAPGCYTSINSMCVYYYRVLDRQTHGHTARSSYGAL